MWLAYETFCCLMCGPFWQVTATSHNRPLVPAHYWITAISFPGKVVMSLKGTERKGSQSRHLETVMPSRQALNTMVMLRVRFSRSLKAINWFCSTRSRRPKTSINSIGVGGVLYFFAITMIILARTWNIVIDQHIEIWEAFTLRMRNAHKLEN